MMVGNVGRGTNEYQMTSNHFLKLFGVKIRDLRDKNSTSKFWSFLEAFLDFGHQ